MLDRLDTKECKELWLFVHFVQQEIRKRKFKVGDKVRILKYDWRFKKSYEPYFTQKFFEVVASVSRKPPTYIMKDE